MNPTVLEKFASEVANHTIFNSWPLFLIIGLLNLLGTLFGSYIGARSSKNAEIAATRENLDEIKRQLAETTKTSKSVEIALSHQDWIRKVENTLRREKLEQLINAAFGLATWTQEDYFECLSGNNVESSAPIDEFEMLAQLYFPELGEHTSRVEISYREAMQKNSATRQRALQTKLIIETHRIAGDAEGMMQAIIDKDKYVNETKESDRAATISVYVAVQSLCTEARRIMQTLTTTPAE